MTTGTPLLDRDPTPEDYEAERDAPRPGVWAGEPGADLRRLTQEETDALIRSELFRSAGAEEVTGVLSAIGGSVSSPPWNSGQPSVQRGGIDSDPLVRILARRAWGDRDRQWFALRGVRKGDRLVRAPLRADWTGAIGQHAIVARWPGDPSTAVCDGVAQRDAYPGETVWVDERDELGRYGMVTRVERRIGDRLREPPHDALRRRFGFDQLTVERDVMRHAQVVTADRAGFRAEWMIAEMALAQAVHPEGLIEMACQGLDRKLPRAGGEPDQNGDIVDEDEMRRALDEFAKSHAAVSALGFRAGDVILERMRSVRADTVTVGVGGARGWSTDGPTHTPGARVAGDKPKPAVPRWARERRNRAARGTGR